MTNKKISQLASDTNPDVNDLILTVDDPSPGTPTNKKVTLSNLLKIYDTLPASLTNKTIDADGTGNVITNIGSSEIKSEIITGQTEEASPVSGDFLLGYDTTAGVIRKFDVGNLPTGGGGEENTASNIGTGFGIFKQKSGIDLEFDSLIGGTGITITDTTDDLTISHDAHTGDVTGSTALTIANSAVSNAKMADMIQDTIKGRVTASTGEPEDLTATQLRTIINVENGANNYSHPNHSGDVTSTGDGATAIGNLKVTNAMLAGSIANTKLATDPLARANHTGTQTASTISDFASVTTTRTNISIDQDGTGNSITNLDVASIKSGSSLLEAAIPFVIDGGGSAIAIGIKGDVEVPFDCTIKSVRMHADTSTTTIIDIWKDTYANLPPVVGNSIIGAGTEPNITAAIKSEDTTFTSWTTTTLSKGDWLRFNVDSNNNATRVTISLLVDRT